MKISDFVAETLEILGQILAHFDRKRRYQDAFPPGKRLLDFFKQIIDLPFCRSDFNHRIQEARGSNDLFDDSVCPFHFKITGRG